MCNPFKRVIVQTTIPGEPPRFFAGWFDGDGPPLWTPHARLAESYEESYRGRAAREIALKHLRARGYAVVSPYVEVS